MTTFSRHSFRTILFWTMVAILVFLGSSISAASSSSPPFLSKSVQARGGASHHHDLDPSLGFLEPLFAKYPHQPLFLQCVQEIAQSLQPLFERGDGFYRRAFLAMAEPERVISFRVPWEDDRGNWHYNRGWRVEFSSVLGPYKGGLRFHPTVDEGVLKFLGFEQVFKNALTGLPLGGGKGGSDFDPKGKSRAEIARFCRAFMTELHRYLHPSSDVPAGDIGVGGEEIGYMYGAYKRLTNRHGEGVLTGKSLAFGGSPLRPEATGYGLVYIARLALRSGKSLAGTPCKVSGSGNVAQYASQKLLQLGAKVLTLSDSNGVLVFPDGCTEEDLQLVMDCKNTQRGRLSELEGKVSGKYVPDCTVWNLPDHCHLASEIALPCATQNEIDHEAAERLVDEGVRLVAEGANLPTTLQGQQVFRSSSNVVYVPAKAANAGGVGVSGLEMSQNAQKLTWSAEEVDAKLQDMMSNIYRQCSQSSKESLEQGANLAGFQKVAHAMRELGWVR